MGERSRRRVRDLVARLAFKGRSQNETERARISMMARSDLLHTRAGYRSARPITAILKIQLATHGRSIQSGRKSLQRSNFRFSGPLDNLVVSIGPVGRALGAGARLISQRDTPPD